MLIACLLWNDFLFDVKRAYRITTNTPVSIYIHNNNWSFKKSDFFFLFRFLAKYSILFNRSSYISDFIKGFGFSLSLFLPASFHFYYNLFEKMVFCCSVTYFNINRIAVAEKEKRTHQTIERKEQQRAFELIEIQIYQS